MEERMQIPQKILMLYEGMTSAQLHQIIIKDDEQSQQALWYLLSVRMRGQLLQCIKSTTDGFNNNARESSDYLQDFFMYVYDYTPANMIRKEHYYLLRRLRDNMKIEPCLYRAFRNYLTLEARNLQQIRDEQENIVREMKEHSKPNYEIDSYRIFCAIALLSQRSDEVNRYILFRSICHKMAENLEMMLTPSDERIAEILDMTYGNYRVRTSRLMAELKKLLTNMSAKEMAEIQPATRALILKFSHSRILLDTILSKLLRQAETDLPKGMAETIRQERKINVFHTVPEGFLMEMELDRCCSASERINPYIDRQKRRKEQRRYFVEKIGLLFS